MLSHFAIRFLVTSVLLVPSLVSCQKAGYSFQPVPIRSHLPPMAADEPLLVAPVRELVVIPALPKQRRTFIHVKGQAPRHTPPKVLTRPLSATLASYSRSHLSSRQSTNFIHRTTADVVPARHKSKAVALLLAVLIGFYGLHRFYLGYYGRGTLQLLLAVLLLIVLLGSYGIAVASPLGVGLVTGSVLLGGLLMFWWLSDIVHIITNKLQPRNGSY